MNVEQLNYLSYLFYCNICDRIRLEQNINKKDTYRLCEFFVKNMKNLGIKDMPSAEWIFNNYNREWKD